VRSPHSSGRAILNTTLQQPNRPTSTRKCTSSGCGSEMTNFMFRLVAVDVDRVTQLGCACRIGAKLYDGQLFNHLRVLCLCASADTKSYTPVCNTDCNHQ
jgi:hypothetical protein